MKQVARLLKWCAVVTMFLSGVPRFSHAVEMLPQGDFETGVSDWRMWHCKGAGAVGTVYSSSDDVRPGSTGKRSLQINTTEKFACGNFIRARVFGLEGGKKYRISVWYKVVAGGAPDGPVKHAIARDMKNDTNQDRKDLHFDMKVDGKWKYLSDEFTAQASTTPEDFYSMMIHLDQQGQGGKGGVIRVDDFSLWDFHPTPAAVESAAAKATDRAQAIQDARLATLMTKTDPNAKRSAGVEAGMLDGYPYLRNKQVTALWSRGKNGGGMLRVHDSSSKKELLRIDEPKATSWKVDVKKSGGERLSYTNAGVPCEVTVEADNGEGKLSFTWPLADLQVTVVARLKADESLVRSRIVAEVTGEGTGLMTVTHPLVSGILPMTEGAAADQILHTHAIGDVKESPLLEGAPVGFKYPEGSMQFTALLGDERGLYCAEEDGQANRKHFDWTPDADRKTLTFSVSHPVLNWGAEKLVLDYSSPGDLVVGPFQGDWFDAARIYRKWALTAPWCRKGPIHARDDYPKWLLNLAYWSNNRMNNEVEIGNVDLHRDFFNLPNVIIHDYGYMPGYDHHSNPEYLPPRIGSANYAQLVKNLRAKDIRVVNYIIGWLWNTTTESYRMEEGEKAGLLMEQGIVPLTYAGSHDLSAGICPATESWRKKMVALSTTLVGKYGVSGLYFDYFTNHTEDCFNTDHGHAIAGGDYWAKAVHRLYEDVRRECKKLDPEIMISAEDTAEWCIDVVDTVHSGGVASDTPIYFAVYHGYTQIFGGVQNCSTPQTLGRWWLTGTQNGENNIMHGLGSGYFGEMGPYYRKLLWCHAQFARPYLGYGEMLRPPKIEGNLPILPGSPCGQYQAAFPVPAVEGSAWRAPDGTIGLFFLNYDKETHKFTWTQDLNEIVGIGPNQKLKVSQWNPKGELIVGEWDGGVLTKTMSIDSWGLIALKLEVLPLKTPTGCRVAEGAKASPEGYADLIIHEKTGIEMILVPAGEFEMGSGKGARQVTIGTPFYMGKTEVTNAQYRRFVEATGYDGAGDLDLDYDMYLRHWRGKSIMSSADDYPVVWVNWKNAKAFCQWAGLALPSDAQWEYACRAETTTPYYFGEDEKEFAKYGWSNTSREYHTHSVAGKLPNTWGLYDMLGNVREWVEDDYVSNEYVELSRQPWWQRTRYAEPPTDGSARLEGRMTKILRGGSWGLGTVVCRSDSRYNYAPTNAGAEIGFRAVLALDK